MDIYISNYNDEYRKNIDKEHYKEGIYWVLVNHNQYRPYENQSFIMCSKNKSIIRFAARVLNKRGSNRMHSSNEIEGKYLVDRAHSKRYINTLISD